MRVIDGSDQVEKISNIDRREEVHSVYTDDYYITTGVFEGAVEATSSISQSIVAPKTLPATLASVSIIMLATVVEDSLEVLPCWLKPFRPIDRQVIR